MHSSWLEIDALALTSNIEHIARVLEKTGPALKLGLVIKGNAYGHGLLEIVNLTKDNPHVHMFLTASLAEALVIRSLNVEQRICSLIPADTGLLGAALKASIEIICFDEQSLEEAALCARQTSTRAQVHIKIDTGLSRLGFLPHEMSAAFAFINEHPEVDVAGLLTHFADYDQPDLLQAQQKAFYETHALCQQLGFRGDVHSTASGSLICAGQDTLVRVGTSAFGYWKTAPQKERFLAQHSDYELKPILSWRSKIMHTKTVGSGCGIGYTHTCVTQRPTRLGIIPVGYADGYPRALSNKGVVYCNNQRAPVIGSVSMNLLTIDITDIPEAVTGDEVILLGDYDGIRAPDIANIVGTNQLEILTNLKESLPRIIA